VVAIPGDIALHETLYREPSAIVKQANPVICPSPEELQQLAAMLNRGQAVTILGGAGCAGAHAELMALAGKLKSPLSQPCAGANTFSMTIPTT